MDPQWLLLMSVLSARHALRRARQSASRFMEWVREHRIEFCLLPAIVYKQPPSPRDRENEIIRVNIYGIAPADHARSRSASTSAPARPSA